MQPCRMKEEKSDVDACVLATKNSHAHARVHDEQGKLIPTRTQSWAFVGRQAQLETSPQLWCMCTKWSTCESPIEREHVVRKQVGYVSKL